VCVHLYTSVSSTAAFSQLYFWVGMHRGRVLPRKFKKIHKWAKPSPCSNPAKMHRTITGILVCTHAALCQLAQSKCVHTVLEYYSCIGSELQPGQRSWAWSCAWVITHQSNKVTRQEEPFRMILAIISGSVNSQPC
jgi:hypothetical protein